MASKPGEHEGVELEFLAAGGAQPGLGDLLDGIAAHIDERDVVAIISLVIVGIEAEPLGADRMILGC
jgi:hypothetical protein